MARNKGKSSKKGSQKSFANDRTMNPPGGGGPALDKGHMGDPKSSQQHDERHVQGSFEGRGTHARTGNPGHS